MVSVKPDPDNAFQHVSGSSHVDEFYRTTSRAYSHRGSWPPASPSQSFYEDSRHQTSRHSDSSVGWPVARQRFPDSRDATAGPALEENYLASRLQTDSEEYSQRRGRSPGEDSGREPWRTEEDRSRQSPPPPPLSSANSDPYRTAPGHHQAAEFGAYRSGAEENGVDQSGLYRPRKLLADFYRHRERQDQHHRQQQQQEAGVELGEDRLMGETGCWVKAASAYDGSPPVESKSAEVAGFFNGRRQTWPLGTSAVPIVRRRQVQQTAADQYGDYVDEDVDQSAIPQQSAGAAASPMSRLIQRYDHVAMTSSAGDAFPVAVSAPSSGRGDWFPMSWQPSITSAAAAAAAAALDNNSSSTENSSAMSEHGESAKTYSCHICSYIGSYETSMKIKLAGSAR